MGLGILGNKLILTENVMHIWSACSAVPESEVINLHSYSPPFGVLALLPLLLKNYLFLHYLTSEKRYFFSVQRAFTEVALSQVFNLFELMHTIATYLQECSVLSSLNLPDLI